MDSFHTQKSKKKQRGRISEKSVQDKALYDTEKENTITKSEVTETFEVNGKFYPLPPDFYELEEFDWDDPENIKMMKEEEEAHMKKYGRITSEQLDEICIIKEQIISENPGINRKNAFDLAWEKFTGKKLSI